MGGMGRPQLGLPRLCTAARMVAGLITQMILRPASLGVGISHGGGRFAPAFWRRSSLDDEHLPFGDRLMHTCFLAKLKRPLVRRPVCAGRAMFRKSASRQSKSVLARRSAAVSLQFVVPPPNVCERTSGGGKLWIADNIGPGGNRSQSACEPLIYDQSVEVFHLQLPSSLPRSTK
jgi:hypothetical protein